jgi:elongation factor Ts
MDGKIGTLVAVNKLGENELAYNIAMHVAAANPKYINPEDVPVDEIEKEKEIYREQLSKAGKSSGILDKIISGKLNKYYEEVCLTKQEYIKDDRKRVEDILHGIIVEKFVRYSL